MKNMNIIAATTVALGSLSYAGGDIVQSVYENEEVYVPVEEAYVEPVVEEYVAPVEEEYVAPVEEAYVEPVVEEYVAPIEEEVIPVQEEVYVAPVTETVETVTPPPEETVTPEEVIAPVAAATALGLYGGLGINLARHETNCNCYDDQRVDRTAGVIGRIGYDINEYIGVEARGIKSMWKKHGGEVVKHYGAFVKPQIPVGDSANIYGLVGYAKTEANGKNRFPKIDADTLALGAGVEYDLSEGPGGLGVFVDYERLIAKKNSPDLDTINFGLTYDF